MTTQAEDLGKLLGDAIAAAADTYAANMRLSSLELATALGKLAEAVANRHETLNFYYPNGGTGHDAGHAGTSAPSSPPREGSGAEPVQGPQNGTQRPASTTDGKVFQDIHGDLWARSGHYLHELTTDAEALKRTPAEVARKYGPLKIILDDNGNPSYGGPGETNLLATAANPDAVRKLIDRAETAEHRLQQLNGDEPEPEWLNGDQLDTLPTLTIAITRGGTEPRWRDETGEWCLLGHNALHGIGPHELAPAEILWTPGKS